ncbi:M48 family peptidase [Ramlibacter henchirensis]|jgi:Zn-dependent protease with chaperone function|uniref:M48 family peptidase n=1 Tax=Ramlibacter henchirensis TaxID=204072 RepID=A0A4Z0C4P4_9BURK|nr:M48 family metallopeptidase [Ramlibacter henchirensis]TFZ06677.1 M48 family peptidase [Ramlibacter henchirensis]
MCQMCYAKASAWMPRRGFLALAGAAGAAAATPALAQVDVGPASRARGLVPAEEIEAASQQQYAEMMAKARQQGALAPDNHPQLQRIRYIASRLIPHSLRWNDRAKSWRWEVNLLGSKQINAFCMPGGKIAIFTGILDQLQLTDDEAANVMGHEIAHAVREHARARIAKQAGTGALLSLGAQLFGLGQLGDVAANIGTQLLTLRFSREDEIESDLIGLEMAARAAYVPDASVSLWEKMGKASGGNQGPAFLSTHPTGPDRLQRLRENVPKVRGLYQQAVAVAPPVKAQVR